MKTLDKKSRMYYYFWSAMTITVFLGQLYVGTGYRLCIVVCKSVIKLMEFFSMLPPKKDLIIFDESTENPLVIQVVNQAVKLKCCLVSKSNSEYRDPLLVGVRCYQRNKSNQDPVGSMTCILPL